MLTNIERRIPLETIKEIQENEEFSILNKLIKNKKNLHHSLDPINSKVFVDWQDADLNKSNVKIDSSIKSRESKFLYKPHKKQPFSYKHEKKNYSVELPSIKNKEITPTNKSTQTSGRKSDFSKIKKTK